jgi:adenine deaminase
MDIETTAIRTRALVDVAMGKKPASIVLRGGQWVCVQSGEILPDTDIAIYAERIAYVGPDAGHTIGSGTQLIDLNGQYMVPGLLDAHMHVESGMLTITEFVRAVAPRGTTGMFIDPHEIANVFGIKGVRLMVDEAANQPIHVWVQMPSCVPSAPGLETPGGTISPDDVRDAMAWKGIIGLGEMMNFPGVIAGDPAMHSELAATRNAGKVIGGHYASPNLGKPFHGYVAGGPEDDHEGTRRIDAVARVRQGLKVMMRYGSAWHDVAEQIKAVTELGLDTRHFLLCTDDSHSETLVREGHMDRVVRHAIQQGLAPLVAIQMATINTAQHFGLSKEIGMIAPGRFADILIVPSLANFHAGTVIAKGKIIADHGHMVANIPAFDYPIWAKSSVNPGKKFSEADFDLITNIPDGLARAHVIEVIENQAPTRHRIEQVSVTSGRVAINRERDLIKIALVERHRGIGDVEIGLVHGFGFRENCAVASTVVHDSHQMIVVGTSEASMALAVNTLIDMNGGQVVVKDGQIIGAVDLPIAGLMSNERAEIVAEKAATILEGFKICGCELNNPNMQLSLLGLVVIPELRLSDKGLVDVTEFKIIPVVEA